MTSSSAIALFSAMFVLALMPSLSVMTVLARSITFGFSHGAATSVGIVASDMVYILLAIYRLALIAGLLLVIRYAGGAYSIWLGLSLWRSKPAVLELDRIVHKTSLLFGFWAGFLLSFSDQKAIFFYWSFSPHSSIYQHDLSSTLAGELWQSPAPQWG